MTALLEEPKVATPSRILLPAGVKRVIRVNRSALHSDGKPFVVTGPDGKEAKYETVEVMGECRFVTAMRQDQADGCYPVLAAFAETDAAILVK